MGILKYITFIVFYLCICCNASSPESNWNNEQYGIKAFVRCTRNQDASCFFDVAENLVNQKRLEYLAEAENSVTGRSENSPPSQLVKLLNQVINEFTDLFRNGITGLFSKAKEADENDEIKEQNNGEARKKKKKEKLKGLIKLILIGALIKAKITILLKLLSAALQVKFFLVALAGLILNAARFYLDLKKGHQPQKVIYYEHAQHQHHYEDHGEEDWGGSSPGGGYWGRSYDEKDKSLTAQDIAYAKQKPKTQEDSWSLFS